MGQLEVPTKKQRLGQTAEAIVASTCSCPKCKHASTLRRPLPNLKCADVICDFCGYLAPVKAVTTSRIDLPPDTILGAARRPQKARLDSGIYFPVFVVLMGSTRHYSDFFLPADLHSADMFVPRSPLSPTDRWAGWQGVLYNLRWKTQQLIKLRRNPPLTTTQVGSQG